MTAAPSTPTSTASSNVRVVARIRPLSRTELQRGSKETVISLNDPTHHNGKSSAEPEIVQVQEASGKKRWFELDAVFDKDSTQEEVYERSGARKSVTEDIFSGFNCTILAYGQTGAGKTYSMGTATEGMDLKPSDGMIPRACHDLFRTIEEKCDGNAKVELSYLEIYNEELRDLLADGKEQTPLKIREALDGEVYVSGLKQQLVNSPKEIGDLMDEASKRRVVAATAMNAVSSRSHAMCVLRVNGIMEGVDGTTDKFSSKLTLVDLAGSERIKKTGAEGTRRQEGININKSLLVLGQVVAALAERNKKRRRKPPYRDSKLTRLLQDSLGGNSQTIMVACASPADFNCEESINTLRYATNARNIKNTATRNLVLNISPEEAAKLQRENQLLKQQVAELQEALKMVTVDLDNISFVSDGGENDEMSTSTGITSSITPSVMDDQAKRASSMIDEQAKRIKDLEKELSTCKGELKAAKIDVRKSCAASAIELPALRAEVVCLKEELAEKESLEEENQRLREELEEVKDEAENAERAASKLSNILEELHLAGGTDDKPLSNETSQDEEEKLETSSLDSTTSTKEKERQSQIQREEAWLSFLCQILDHNKNHMKKLSEDFAFGVVRAVEDMSMAEMPREQPKKSFWSAFSNLSPAVPQRIITTSDQYQDQGLGDETDLDMDESSRGSYIGSNRGGSGRGSFMAGGSFMGGGSTTAAAIINNAGNIMNNAGAIMGGSNRGIGGSNRGMGGSNRGSYRGGGSYMGESQGSQYARHKTPGIQQRMLREQVKFFHDRMKEIEGTFRDESTSLKSIQLSLRNEAGEAENGIKDFLRRFLNGGSGAADGEGVASAAVASSPGATL